MASENCGGQYRQGGCILYRTPVWPFRASPSSQLSLQTIASLLTCVTLYPMYVAQSFMGNMPNRDTGNAKQLAEILGIPWGENGYGPFVPDSLIPATYGFTFRSDSHR